MTLIEVIKKRHSVRKFQEKEVSKHTLEEIIALAEKAPSAGAIRGYKAIITTEQVARPLAPIYIVICANPGAYLFRYGERGRNLYSIQDATIFAAYIQLLLVDKGLSSCWVGAFMERKVKKILNTNLHPIAILSIGYET